MSLQELLELAGDQLPCEMTFHGICSDCGEKLSIVARVYSRDPMEIEIEGGAVYRIHAGEINRTNVRFKCEKCFQKDRTLRRPIEVYSRCCGYYRPVRQWNMGKQSEFHSRTPFRIKPVDSLPESVGSSEPTPLGVT